jgi:hypothetical protein
MELSPNFQLSEFEKDGAVPEDCVQIFRALAVAVLEPIRAYLNRPMIITSGYRSDAINKADHGAPNSEHVARPFYCAADFVFDTKFGSLVSFRMLFDWIRMNKTLPFHQVILEHGQNGSNLIHISLNIIDLSIREALEGATYNRSGYSKHDVALYAGAMTLDLPLGQESTQDA